MILPGITRSLRVAALVGSLLVSAGVNSPDSIRAQSPSPPPSKNQKPSAAATVAEPSTKSFAGLGPSPSGADVRVLPIDLPTALRLADANNPTIALARERINEAYAHLRQAQVLWLPNLQTGPAYVRHDGLWQNSSGLIISPSKWNFFEGGGAALSVETSDALFAPLVARRLVEAQTASAQGVANRVQVDAARRYFDLLQTYGALAINAETLANAQRSQQLADQIEKAGLGKTPGDANRVRTEVQLRQQERVDLEGQAAVASAQLAQILMLDPTVDLRPADPAIVPITLVSAESALDELTATGLMNRPELAEGRAQVAAALANWRQARTRPFLPRLEIDYNAGEFGGGTHDESQRFGSRGDGLAQAVWTLHNLGAGDVAVARARRSQYTQTNLHLVELETLVAAEVTATAKLARSRRRALEHAQQAVQDAEKAWQQVLNFTLQAAFRKVRQFEALELLIAERDLNQVRMQYLTEVIEYNRAQFQLYWALGQPPLESLGQITPLPVQTPVLPPEKTQK
jgi:outer membrane protein TolC